MLPFAVRSGEKGGFDGFDGLACPSRPVCPLVPVCRLLPGPLMFFPVSFLPAPPDSGTGTGMTCVRTFRYDRRRIKRWKVLCTGSAVCEGPFPVFPAEQERAASRPEPVCIFCSVRIRSFFPLAGNPLLFFDSRVIRHNVAASPDNERDKGQKPGAFVIIVWHGVSPEGRFPFPDRQVSRFTVRVPAGRWPCFPPSPRSLP